jgi:hypothetical protein
MWTGVRLGISALCQRQIFAPAESFRSDTFDMTVAD